MSEWRARCMTSCAAKRNPLRPGQRRSNACARSPHAVPSPRVCVRHSSIHPQLRAYSLLASEIAAVSRQLLPQASPLLM